MSMEQSVECLAEVPVVLGENMLQCRFVHNNSHSPVPGFELGLPATNRLNYGMAYTLLAQFVTSKKNALLI
jgi:hypothetical protein